MVLLTDIDGSKAILKWDNCDGTVSMQTLTRSKRYVSIEMMVHRKSKLEYRRFAGNASISSSKNASISSLVGRGLPSMDQGIV